MAKKLTHWLTMTLVISLGFGQLLRFSWLGVPLYLHDLLVVAILVLLSWDLQGRTLKGVPKLFLLGLSLAWLHALTLYPLASLAIPALYTLRLLSYLWLYLSLSSAKLDLPRWAFITSGLTTLILGLAQYFLMPDMRWAQYLGWDDHLNRLILPHFDPTYTSVMLGLFILTLTRSEWQLGALASLSILLTYSRSVWLSLVLTGFLFIKRRLILVLFLLTLGLGISLLPERFGEGTNLLRSYSLTSRATADLAYVETYTWGMLLGRGLNTLILDQGVQALPNHATGPNNSYLYLLLTTGVIGLTGFLLFLRRLYLRSLHRPLIIFLLIASLFNNVLLYPFVLLWLFLSEFMAPSEV